MSIVNNFNITVNFPNINDRISKANEDGIPVCPNIPQYTDDTVIIDGIIGMDLIPRLRVCELSVVNGNSYFRFANGYIPVGHIKIIENPPSKPNNNMNKKRHDSVVKTPVSNKFNGLIDLCSNAENKNVKPMKMTHSRNNNPTTSTKYKINNTLPKNKFKVYEPSAKQIRYAEKMIVNAMVTDTDYVANNLEKSLTSLESIGIHNEISQYDNDMMEWFKSKIEIKDGRYQVELSWDKDTLKRVPSNFVLTKMLAKKIAERCMREGFLHDYESIFDEQLNKNIIEPINVDEQFDPENYKWIPHHPVVKKRKNQLPLKFALY